MSAHEISSTKVQYTKEKYVASCDSTIVAKNMMTLPLVSEEALNSNQIGDNVDKKNKNKNVKTLDEKYLEIKDICDEYRINLDEAKKCKLLEGIAGCTTEELAKMNNEEFKKVLTALKDSLGITGQWKWLWENRDKDDIEEIKAEANKRYTRLNTGGSWLGQKLYNFTKGSLLEDLVSKGYLNEANRNNFEKVKVAITEYVKKEYLADIKNLSNEEKEAKYTKLKEDFGYMINQSKNAEEKAFLTKIIEELKADDRLNASKVLLGSTKVESKERSTVALAVATSHTEIVTKEDAFGKTVNSDDSIKLAQTSFENMDKEDTLKALNEQNVKNIKEVGKIKSQIEELRKKQADGTITEEEKKELRKLEAIAEGYTGATFGVNNNKTLSKEEKQEITGRIFTNIKVLENATGIKLSEEVAAKMITYLEKNPNAINLPKKELLKRLNDATNGELSKFLKRCRYKISAKSQINTQTENKTGKAAEPDKKETKTTYTEYEQEAVETEVVLQTEEFNYTYTNASTTALETPVVNTDKDEHIKKDTTELRRKFYEEYSIENSNTSEATPVVAQTTPKTVEEAVSSGKITEYCNKNGKAKTINEIFSDKLKNLYSLAKTLFTQLSNKQDEILIRCNNTGLKNLIPNANDSALIKLEGETFNNYWASNFVKERSEEAKKRKYKNSCLEQSFA